MELIHCVLNKRPVEEVKLLLLLGCCVNRRDYIYRTALHYCQVYTEGDISLVRNGVSVIRLLLQSGAEVNIMDKVNMHNPLQHYLYCECHPDLLYALLESKVNVNSEDAWWNVALFYYIRSRPAIDLNIDLFKRLIPVLVINRSNCGGETSLMASIRKGCKIEFIRALIDVGADPSIRYDMNRNSTIFHAFIEGYRNPDDNSLEVLKLLLNGGADVNYTDRKGFTPLTLFLERGFSCIRHVKALLDKGANAHVKDRLGNSVLHHRVMSCSVDLCQLFLDCGVDPNAWNASGETPIMHAVRYCLRRNVDFIATLRNYGAKMSMSCLATGILDRSSHKIRNLPRCQALLNYTDTTHVNEHEGYETILKHTILSVPHFLECILHKDHNPDLLKLKHFGSILYEELVKMHKYTCPSGNKSLCEFLLHLDPAEFVLYFENCDSVDRELIEAEFPEFGTILWSKIEFAIRWFTTRNRLARISISSIPIEMEGKEVTLNSDCNMLLAKYLSNYDVQKLILASVNV